MANPRLARELAALPREPWARIFEACAVRLRALGRLGGAIAVADASSQEALDRMGVTVRAGRMQLKALDRAMRKGRIVEGLIAAVECWTGAPIVPVRVERDAAHAAWTEEKERWIEYARSRTERLIDEERHRVLAWIERAARQMRKRWVLHPDRARRTMRHAIRGVCAADPAGEPETLAVFAERVSGNPHTFDANRLAGRILVSGLRARFDLQHVGIMTAEDRASILEVAGLASDGVSSRVITYGLQGDHPLLAAASVMNEPVTLMLMNLEHVHRVTATSQRVFVVENPAVFTHIVRACAAWVRERGRPAGTAPSIVCTSGQFGVAAARLLDRLVASGCGLWYSGDFDLPGIGMAERVAQRYGAAVSMWRMSGEAYEHRSADDRCDLPAISVSDDAWPAARRRLRDLIEQHGERFQEGLVHLLVSDVLQSLDPRSAHAEAPEGV